MSSAPAYLYARFSSKRQEQGSSLERQQLMAADYCKKHGLELQDTSFYDLGVSGFSKKNKDRPMFGELLLALEQGRIPRGAYLLFESTDRLSREPWIEVQKLIINTVMTYSVTLVMMDKNQVFNQSNALDIAGNIILMTVAEQSHKESMRKSDLVAAAYKQKRDRGEVSRFPFWISQSPSGPVLNEKADIARQIVAMRLRGVGALGIASELNRQGVPAPRGGIWRHTTVQITIRNSALMGTKDFRLMKAVQVYDAGSGFGVEKQNHIIKSVADALPALIDAETFERIQIRGEKPGRKSTGSPFSNMIKCVCGGSLVMHIDSGHNHRKCSNSKVSACKFKMIRNFDQILIECLSSLTYESTAAPVQTREPEYKARLDKLEQVKASLVQAGAVDALADLYKDIADTKSLLAAEQQKAKPVLDSIELKSVFTGSVDEQRAALKQRVERVVVKRVVGHCTITVKLTNGHTRVFGVRLGEGKGKVGQYHIETSTDTEAWKTFVNDLAAGVCD